MKKGAKRTENALYSYNNVLNPKDCELHQRILQAWEARRRGAKNHKEESFKRDVYIVNNFILFSGQPPWKWTEGDFDDWCYHNGVVQKHAMATQRSYQSAIRNFLKYVTESHRFRDEIKRLTGRYPEQICTSDNCIPHMVERELDKSKPSFSHAEIDQFFGSIQEKIAECVRYEKHSGQSLKSKHAFQRDMAMFATIYEGCLRASEAILMDETSFVEEPLTPELKEYGYMEVQGKGARGSGKRWRNSAVTQIQYVDLMNWYLDDVRPWFQLRADPNEDALFMSERGDRISYANMRARFNDIVDLAGLSKKNFTMHAFRRAGLFHDSCNMSVPAVQSKAGHVDIRTTVGYFPEKDPYLRDEFAEVIRKQLQRIAAKGKADNRETHRIRRAA
jgi:site-specific recombinase XerD